MNKKRRFLLGTVLSIQNTGFTYPACHNCFSRVIHTADRYQCQKCSDTYQNATHRYRLCVKVAEDQKLHIITVFGSCVEKIFGSSANSLHRHLQESDQPSCDIGWDKAQQLLYQAAEDCLIGRSFIFAVKVPDHLQRDGSSNSSQLVACQIIPIKDDHAVSILNRYHRLVEFISSNSMINTRHELSAQSTHRGFWDLTDSESSHSLHQSANQFADYWQQSLGLASSPTLNTSAETPSCSPSPSQTNKAKGKSCEGEHKFKKSIVLAQGNVKPTDHKVIVKDYLCIPKNSPLRVKSPSANIVATCGYNQCPSHANCLFSRMSCQHHRHLQNVCNSNSYGCQDCSACLKCFPSQKTQTAESHQDGNGTWDEFPFSESLSEFIARLENSEEERFNFSVKENKFRVGNKKEEFYEGHSKTAHDLIKTPVALLAPSSKKIKTPTKTRAPHCLGDTTSNTIASKEPYEVIQSDDLQEALASSASENLQGLLQKRFIPDFSSKDTVVSVASSVSSYHDTFLPMNESAPYIVTESKRNLEINTINKSITKYILSVGHYSSSHPKETGDVDHESRLDLDLLKSDNLEPTNASPGIYNASADLFDDVEKISGETLQSKHTRSLKRSYAKEVRNLRTPSSWESPCTDVIVRRNSQFQASYLQEVHETGTIHDLLSCLQSTPMLRPLSESSFFTGDGCILSDPRAPVLSRRSSNSLTNFLLKKMKQSLSRTRSNMYCTTSDNLRLCSPIFSSFSEISRCHVLQRRSTQVIKSGKKKLILEDKENCNIRGFNGVSNEDGGDRSIVIRQEMERSEIDIVQDGVTTSPLMPPLHRFIVENSLPSEWSPELFNEKSNVSKENDTLQRRLF